MTKEEFLKYCEIKTPSHLKSLVPNAIESAKKSFNILYDKKEALKVIQLAEAIYSSMESIEKKSDPEIELYVTPETIIISEELVKEILPFIEKLRIELFNHKTPPFPDDLDKAIKWLEKEAEDETLSLQDKIKKNSNKENELIFNATLRDLFKLNKVFPDRIWTIKYEILTLPYQDKNGFRKKTRVFKGTPLEMLAENTRILSENTNFTQQSLVNFILTGTKPSLPCMRLKQEIKTTYLKVNVEFFRSLDYKELLSLHRRIKKMFKLRMKSINWKHLEVYDLVDKNGGVPKKRKMKFWEKVWEEWNNHHPDAPFKSPGCLRVSYARILEGFKVAK